MSKIYLYKGYFSQSEPRLSNEVPVAKDQYRILANTDGGKNHFYDIPDWVKDADDLAEYLGLNGFLFNILKTLWANRGKRHEATDEMREAKKRKHYADRELKRLEKA